MKKSIACLLALLLLAVPLLAWAEGETIYSIVDAQGQYITHFVGEPAQGDEYIAHDNSHYVITAVDVAAHTAQAEKKGAYPMPDVSWLSEDSRAVSSGTQRHAVALYCTHSDESYEPTDGASSITPRGSIYDVAQALKSNLEQRGVKVYYDDSTHLPHDSGAYKRSRSTAANLLENGVDAIFDIHRDASRILPSMKQPSRVKRPAWCVCWWGAPIRTRLKTRSSPWSLRLWRTSCILS